MPREIVHVGRKIQVALDTDTGNDGQPVKRDVILHPGAVVILPILEDDRVVLLKNYRPAVEDTLWEVPAGTLEGDEPFEIAAARELKEETGYTANQYTYWGYLYASPGVLNEKLHIFFAEELTPGDASPEPCEKIEPIALPFEEALRMAHSGDIRDAKTITALLLWQSRHRSE